MHFPRNAIIAMIQRDGQYLTPNGSTRLEINDKLFILSGSLEGMRDVMRCFNEQGEACAQAVEATTES